MEPQGSLPHSQGPATCPYPDPAQSSPYPQHPTSWRSILILSYHLRLGRPSALFPSATKTLYTPLLYPPCVLHALPNSFFSILSPDQYWVRSTDQFYTISGISWPAEQLSGSVFWRTVLRDLSEMYGFIGSARVSASTWCSTPRRRPPTMATQRHAYPVMWMSSARCAAIAGSVLSVWDIRQALISSLNYFGAQRSYAFGDLQTNICCKGSSWLHEHWLRCQSW